MEINLSRFVVSNIYKYVCLVYMHSSYAIVYFFDLYIQCALDKHLPQWLYGLDYALISGYMCTAVQMEGNLKMTFFRYTIYELNI